MAGTIVVDRLESDASYASSINVASPLVVSNTISIGSNLAINSSGINATSLAYGTLPSGRLPTIPRANMPTGAVLQVVSTTKTDTASGTNLMSSGSWANVLQASITPTSSTSKILIIYSLEFSGAVTNGDSTVVARLVRGSTAICIGDTGGTRNRVTNGQRWPSGRTDFYGTHNQNFLDSPSTTSSTTYSVQMAVRGASSATWYCNRSLDDYDGSEGSRSASTITLMEIAA
jgi:hypothetical protein